MRVRFRRVATRSMAWYGEGVQILFAVTLFAALLHRWKLVSEVHCTSGDWRYVNEWDKHMEEHYGKEAADLEPSNNSPEAAAEVESSNIYPGKAVEFEAAEFEPSSNYSEAAAEVETSNDNDPIADHVISEKMSPASITPTSAEMHVLCSEYGFRITAALVSLKEVKVLGPTNLLSIMDAQQECGYDVMPLLNTVIIPFSGCHVRLQNAQYTVQLVYINVLGQTDMVTASCTERSDLVQQASYKHGPKCLPPPPVTTHPVTTIPTNSKNCTIPKEQRLTCGPIGISPSDCLKMGCCVDSGCTRKKCYYPLDVCTRDQQFVFAIHRDSTSVPVDPTKLVIPGHPRCKPVISNAKFAIFKFSVTECGTRFYVVGETMIYLAEVQTVFFALSLKYGVITRSNSVRFLIECRYPKSHSGGQLLVSVGYMVKIPSFQSVLAPGRYGVELLIAEDATYTKYLPSYHQPLWKILGKPVYLELRVRSAITTAVLLVNYCLAYPRSASTALVLVYEGCANPFDPNVAVLHDIDQSSHQYRRRFMVEAFQFMDLQTKKYIDEEIYFMCSTDVCMPKERKCVQRCFDGNVIGGTSAPSVLPPICPH